MAIFNIYKLLIYRDGRKIKGNKHETKQTDAIADFPTLSRLCGFRGRTPGSEAEDFTRDCSAGGGTDGDLRSD